MALLKGHLTKPLPSQDEAGIYNKQKGKIGNMLDINKFMKNMEHRKFWEGWLRKSFTEKEAFH